MASGSTAPRGAPCVGCAHGRIAAHARCARHIEPWRLSEPRLGHRRWMIGCLARGASRYAGGFGRCGTSEGDLAVEIERGHGCSPGQTR